MPSSREHAPLLPPLAQLALAPGCVVPGRSLIALFVNTAALLWFFAYLLWELYGDWTDVRARDRGSSLSLSLSLSIYIYI